MMDEVLYCFDDQDTDKVAQDMGECQIRRMSVVNRKKELVGMVSLGDLSIRIAGEAADVAPSEVSEPREPAGHRASLSCLRCSALQFRAGTASPSDCPFRRRLSRRI